MVLFRRLLGEVLRGARMQRGMTLRELSAEARVSLGYISEIERGQKEASSELLASLCQAMDLPLSDVLRDVADAVALEEIAIGLVSSTQITVARPTGDLRPGERTWVYRRDKSPCRRCGTPIQVALIGEAGRERAAYWCPSCQPA